MLTLFSSYRLIPAESIIRANVRVDHINDDLSSLINTLVPLKSISLSKLTDGSALNTSIVEKLAAKKNMLNLLEYYGYERNNQGEYIYHTSTSGEDTERRQNGVNELGKFFNDLKNVQKSSSDDLQRFLQNVESSYHNSREQQVEHQPQPREVNRPFHVAPAPLPPQQHEIEDGNRKTLEIMQSLKKTLVTKYNTSPTPGFIRRKIAIVIYKRLNSYLNESDDDFVGQAIDQEIIKLKNDDTQTNVPRTDDVYIECLIRSNFNKDKALEILSHKRPNLMPPIKPPAPTKSTTKISIAKSIEHIKQHWSLLNQSTNDGDSDLQSAEHEDKWKSIAHLAPCVKQLHQKNHNTNVGEIFFSKMCRLLYSELFHRIGPQSTVKIETLASILCESSAETIENLDLATIKNILCSSSDFHDGFGSHAMSFLSMTCPICTGSFPRTQMETMYLCDHECCLDCVKRYYRSTIHEITDSNSLNRLTCFQQAHEITTETEHDFFIYLDSKLRQWFRDEPVILERFHRNSVTAASGKQIKPCGSPTCSSYFIVDDDDEVGCARCADCQFAQCSQCSRKWHAEHAEMECEEYAEWLLDNDPDDEGVQTLRYLSETGIVCPKEDCAAIYQYKAGGCEHFTCSQCQTQFCRMCSAFFYSPSKEVKCPKDDCVLKKTLHAHCCANCFRETRIGEIDAILNLLLDHAINVAGELEKNPVSADKICPVEGCDKPTSTICEERLCEICYKQLLCSLIWRHQLEPWVIYEDNNLQQMLRKASIPTPDDITREDLITLCKQHLNASLGKPKKLKKPRS